MALTRDTNFYFKIGHTMGLLRRLMGGGRGIFALKPVVRGPRIVGCFRGGNIHVVSDPSRYGRNSLVIIEARNVPGSVVRGIGDVSPGCYGTAYPFIAGVRGVMDRGSLGRGMALVTNSGSRPRIVKVEDCYGNHSFIFGDRGRLSGVVRGRPSLSGGNLVLISRAAFDAGVFRGYMGGVGVMCAGTMVFSAVYYTARRERGRTTTLSLAGSTVIVVNKERDDGATGLGSIYRSGYPAFLVRATTRLRSVSLSQFRSINIATKTSAPSDVVGRMLGAVSRGRRVGGTSASIRGRRRRGPSNRDFTSLISRCVSSDSSRGIINCMMNIAPARVRIRVTNEGRTNCVPLSRCDTSPGTSPRGRIGINSGLSLVVVGAGSRRNAVVLSGEHCSTTGT